MAWVKSEYAGELAVLSAWIAALIPWYVAYSPAALAEIAAEDGSGAILDLRWPFVQARYIFGVPIADGFLPTTVVGATNLYQEVGDLWAPIRAWQAGAAVVAVAVLLSFAMYADHERVEAALPLPSVRLMGALLGIAGLCFTVATALFYTRTGFQTYPVPVGLLVVLALAGLLLRADLVEEGSVDAAAGSGSDDAA